MTPRLGFLGAGWIGRNRMEAVVAAGAATAVVVADADVETAKAAAAAVGAVPASPGGLFDHDLDGVVVATPSALHAEQAVAALDRGLAVFCQKPLGRNESECRAVVDAAKRADLLLGVDLSYRHLAAVAALRDAMTDVGDVYAVDLVFHNAYGPDKPWFTDPALSGGGCVVDLGIHLVDLALWLTGETVTDVSARLFRRGRALRAGEVEDHAVATLGLAGGGVATLACSWFLPAGQHAVIGASFYGTRGAVELRNVGGSFYDFAAWRNDGTTRTALAGPPDDWGGRAIVAWARRVGTGFDPESERLVDVARVLDRVYACAS